MYANFWKLLKELWNGSLLLTAAFTKSSNIITSLPLILVFEIVGCKLNFPYIFNHFQCTVCCHRKEDFQTSHFLKRMLSLRHLLTTQVLTEVIVCQKKKYIHIQLSERLLMLSDIFNVAPTTQEDKKCINTTIFFRSDHRFFLQLLY